MRRGLLGCLVLLAAAVPAAASFEPMLYSPRAAAMGGAMTAAVDEPSAQFYNPATLGTIDAPAASLNYLREFHTPAGDTNQDVFDAIGVVPVKQEIVNGTFGMNILYNHQSDFAAERAVGFNYGTRAMWAQEDKRLDLGGGFRTLKKTFDSRGSAPLRLGLDMGALYRWDERYSLGMSLLNWDRPPTNGQGIRDRVPAEIRMGFAESVRGYNVGFDFAKREPSFDHRGTAEFAAGFERWWATARAGTYSIRTGLSLGDLEKTWSWGFGWRTTGAEISYAMLVPMRGRSEVGHAVGLTFRFGHANPEKEYEKVLATEIRYRQDLAQALEAGEVKQWKLAEELSRMRDELDALRRKLSASKNVEAETRQRLEEVEKRHREAVDTFERLKKEGEAARNKTKQALYDEDWAAYQRLKSAGAPDSILADHLKQLLQQYKTSGVDLSDANQELMRLLRR